MTSSLDIQYHHAPPVIARFKSFTNFMSNQVQKYKDNVFLRYFTIEDGKTLYKTLSYAEVDLIATNLACKWSKYTKNVKTVGFIADHSVSYCISMLALLKLRVTMLCISPRNSEVAIVNLLEKTGCTFVIANNKYESVTKTCVSQVSGSDYIAISDFNIEALSNSLLDPKASEIIDTNFSDEDILKPALIIHSSGSTSLPKPIYISNRYLFYQIHPFYQLINVRKDLKPLDSSDVFLCCAPLFHLFAFASVFSMAILGGSSVFLERLPPSQEEIRFALDCNKCTLMCATPFILEQMVEYFKKTNDATHASTLKYVLYGGANLKIELGQWLHEHGINARNIYGVTEAGSLLGSDLHPKSKNWAALAPFVFDENGASYCVFEVDDVSQPNIKHLYIQGDSPTFALNVSNRPDGGFDTNDLFIEDPQFPGYYNYYGRRDDLIVLENGQKTNPIPMEDIIRQSPIVSQVAVIGNGRQCTSALVSLNVDYASTLTPSKMIDEVHKAVKEANKICPNYSVILPEMVEILPLDTQLKSTAKGNVMRKKAEMDHKDILDRLYRDLLEGPSPSLSPVSSPISSLPSPCPSTSASSVWTKQQTKDFLTDTIAEVLGVSVFDLKDQNQSLFDVGLNSLTSIQLRNKISRYFDNISQNFIFQHSSIHLLCEALMEARIDDASEQVIRSHKQTQKITEEYLRKAKIDFNATKNNYNENKPKVVLLTGATGSLGSFILRDLLNDPSIKKVYCTIRGKQEELHSRLIESFKIRSLDTTLLQNKNRIEALPMNFNEPYLGFGKTRYNELKEEVTIIQHCGWLLDFNMPISHFERECIAPFYNLLKFAYKEVNSMHVHFISSVSASAAVNDTEISESPLPSDPGVAMPIGYAQSKFVVEILLGYLREKKNFPCYIERLGQVCGDFTHGIWNVSEQYPLMFIGGGSIMHKMPKLDTVIDWIPADYASASITSLMVRTSNSPANEGQYIFHIVNPQTCKWTELLELMKMSGMQFDIVSPEEWIESLSKDESNPAYRLFSFYENEFQNISKWPLWKTEKTEEMAPILKETPVIDLELFSKFLKHWQSVGFYNPTV